MNANRTLLDLVEKVKQALGSVMTVEIPQGLGTTAVPEDVYSPFLNKFLRTSELFPGEKVLGAHLVSTNAAFGICSATTNISMTLKAANVADSREHDVTEEELRTSKSLDELFKATTKLGGSLFLHERNRGEWVGITVVVPVSVSQEPVIQETGTILLVEDEEFVRNVTREVLEMAGYEVLEAIDAETGIELFKKNIDRIELLLTDVVMPGMNGRELANRLLSLSPRLKLIFMSGYTENPVVREGFADPRLVYLQKPFTVDMLTRKVKEVLESRIQSHSGDESTNQQPRVAERISEGTCISGTALCSTPASAQARGMP